MDEKRTPDNSKVRPTKKQKELLTFIENFINEHGYSPSYREIMQGLNYTSVATVSLHVNNLIKRGHLKKRDNSARSLEVTKPGDSVSISSNQVQPDEEKWLVGKVEYFFKQAEAMPKPEQSQIDQLQIMLAALKILGLDGAAQSFTPRLTNLKQASK